MRAINDSIPDPSLVLYIPLHRTDGNELMSNDAYGHLCTVNGPVWEFNGRYFDGIDDHLKIPASATQLDFTTEDFTFILWLYMENEGEQVYLWDRGVANTDGYYFRINADGSLFLVTNAPQAESTQTTPGDIAGGKWIMITIVKAGKSLTCYRDDVALKNTVSGTHHDIVSANRDTYIISRRPGTSNVLMGILGEILVYRRALSPIEIQLLYSKIKLHYR